MLLGILTVVMAVPTGLAVSHQANALLQSVSTLDELVDSPILAGPLETLRFEALGKPHELVLDGLAGITPPDTLVPDTVAIIEQAAAIFGGALPYEEYRFLCMFTDAGRGGLEHLASSALLAGAREPTA